MAVVANDGENRSCGGVRFRSSGVCCLCVLTTSYLQTAMPSNPFASSEGHQPPSGQASAPITLSSPPSQPAFDSSDLEEPPPYTPSVSLTSGETTIEVGPSRPFQSTQPSPNPPRSGASQVSHNRIASSPSFPSHTSSSSLPLTRRSTSTVQQLSNSFTDIVNHLSASVNTLQNTSDNWRAASSRSTGLSNNWSSYPGQVPRGPPPSLSNPTPHNTNDLGPPPVPPRHPHSSLHPPLSSTSTHSLPSMSSHSDFARDFYAAGSGSGENLVSETAFAPPAGPPPSTRQTPTTQSVPNDGRPTSQPQPGHPLLKDGNLLVYTKGFECGKCHNMGYKEGNPQKPCNQCWRKYAKPFSGPLVYSFPANSDPSSLASNLQKPLPHTLRSAPAVATSSASQPARLTRSNPDRHPPSRGGYNNPPPPVPMRTMPASAPVGPPSVTYVAGDPRIGGTLCWKCGGQGTFELFIFRETCSLCSGIGRIFN